jgi:hypothetical protein
MRKKHAINFIDLTGKNFGRLTVLKLAEVRNWISYWLCKCRCGNTTIVYGGSLKDGVTQSCGCLIKESMSRIGKTNKIHGMSFTQFHKIWHMMKQRCLNPNAANYPLYGGRGIKVCDRWLEFLNFKEDLYESYLKHVEEFGEDNTSLDRWPNNDGDYKVGNIRWATKHEQNLHTRVSTKTENYDDHMYWKRRLQSCLNSAIRYNNKTSPLLEKYLGCSLIKFKHHIESQFTEGMTWDNHGKGFNKWEFDHIKGCNNFDLSKEKDKLICWNYKNIRPMWLGDHVKKSKRRKIV